MVIIIRKIQIYKGQKFKKLTILKEVEPKFDLKGRKRRIVKVICECGNIKDVGLQDLRNGHTTSCGCYNLEKSKTQFKKHGYSGTRLYNIWKDMKKRCYNTNSSNYKNYGARGITVNEQWMLDYVNFHNWSTSNGYNDELSIDRIDVNGNYEPNNCRWITHKEQLINTRKQRPFKAVSPEGNIYFDKCILTFSETHKLNKKCVSDCLNKKQHSHKNWIFERLDD